MGTTIDCGPAARDLLARLSTPARNRYYYGKLLDAHHLDLEQSYHNRKRWLLNRLSLGTGALCGLEVSDNIDHTELRVSAGVAIDGWGREIIVPVPSRGVDPRQPSDDCGRPMGTPIAGAATVTLWICYHECEAEPAPALVPSECGDPVCENGLIRERYRLRITQGLPPEPGIVTEAQCEVIMAAAGHHLRRRVATETLATHCAEPPESCVPLATITLNDAGRVVQIDPHTFRPSVYSNAVLLDLILCLAARLDACCPPQAVRYLAIVSGNSQTANAGTPVPAPLVVRVTESGNAVAEETVTFTVASVGALVGPDATDLSAARSTPTAADGTATLPVWQLGPNPGPQQVTARIAAGTPNLVTFNATAQRVVLDLPVVRALWPPEAQILSTTSNDPLVVRWLREWIRRPRIEVTFNRTMNPPDLAEPDPWLRVFLVRSFGQNEIVVERLPIRYAGITATPMLGSVPGPCEVYDLTLPNLSSGGLSGARVLVLMVAQPNKITDTSTPPQLLDAEFAGTRLPAGAFDKIWQLGFAGPQSFEQAVWDSLVDTGARLPQSGDGVQGGRFDSWFGFLIG